MFGATAICDALRPTLEACDDGDAGSCLALGQYMEDNPPRSMLSRVFFARACKLGDEDGCRRLRELDSIVGFDR